MPFLFNSLDLISGELAADFRTDSKEFKNLTAGYYSLALQKMEALLEIDSANNALLSTYFVGNDGLQNIPDSAMQEN